MFTAIVTKELDTWPEAESTCKIIVFQNYKYLYLISIAVARRRRWFTLQEAHRQLSLIKPVQKLYIEEVISQNSCT